MKIIVQLDEFNKTIKYRDINHTYVFKPSNTRLTSVTTLLGKYTPAFRSKYWRMYKALQASGYQVKSDATRVVKKDHIYIMDSGYQYNYMDLYSGKYNFQFKVTPDDLLREWQYKALVGQTRGTIIHNYLEHAWQGKMFPSLEWSNIIERQDIDSFAESILILRNQADSFLEDHSHLVPIKLEQIVGDPNLRVAGQIDAILYNPETNEYYLYDYKTDKKIEYDSPFDNMLNPLDKVSACNFNKYSLQIGIYKYLLELHTDIKISDCRIIWFNQYNSNYQSIKLKNMDQQIIDVLSHHSNKLI